MIGKPTYWRMAAAILAAATLAGCAVHAAPRHQGHYQPHYQPQQALHIPPGHMPPPGKCRIWFPDRPPGHQGPIGKCSKLQSRVPPGAILVQG